MKKKPIGIDPDELRTLGAVSTRVGVLMGALLEHRPGVAAELLSLVSADGGYGRYDLARDAAILRRFGKDIHQMFAPAELHEIELPRATFEDTVRKAMSFRELLERRPIETFEQEVVVVLKEAQARTTTDSHGPAPQGHVVRQILNFTVVELGPEPLREALGYVLEDGACGSEHLETIEEADGRRPREWFGLKATGVDGRKWVLGAPVRLKRGA